MTRRCAPRSVRPWLTPTSKGNARAIAELRAAATSSSSSTTIATSASGASRALPSAICGSTTRSASATLGQPATSHKWGWSATCWSRRSARSGQFRARSRFVATQTRGSRSWAPSPGSPWTVRNTVDRTTGPSGSGTRNALAQPSGPVEKLEPSNRHPSGRRLVPWPTGSVGPSHREPAGLVAGRPPTASGGVPAALHGPVTQAADPARLDLVSASVRGSAERCSPRSRACGEPSAVPSPAPTDTFRE